MSLASGIMIFLVLLRANAIRRQTEVNSRTFSNVAVPGGLAHSCLPIWIFYIFFRSSPNLFPTDVDLWYV